MKSKFKTQNDDDTFAFELSDDHLKLTIDTRVIMDGGAVLAILNVDEVEVLRDELDRYAKALRAQQPAATALTLAEMKALYERVTRCNSLALDGKYAVRVYDGMDAAWVTVKTELALEDALKLWCTQTNNGTVLTTYDDIDYYAIFPANTKMLRSHDDGEG